MADKVENTAKNITSDEALLRTSLAENNAEQAGYAAEKLRIDSGLHKGMGPDLTSEESRAVIAAVKAKDDTDKLAPMVIVDESGKIQFTPEAEAKLAAVKTDSNLQDFTYGEFKADWEGKGHSQKDLDDRVKGDIVAMGQLWSGGAQKLAKDFGQLGGELGSPGVFGLNRAISDELARVHSPYRFDIHTGGQIEKDKMGAFNIIDSRSGKRVMKTDSEF